MYIDKNSNRYEGQWRNDRAEGYGIKVFAKGDKHEGYYSNDKRNGFGTYYWANGCVEGARVCVYTVSLPVLATYSTGPAGASLLRGCVCWLSLWPPN